MKTLGKTGVQVSQYCLGAMMFGTMGNPDHGECSRMIDHALESGINFIDTADGYSGGESEEIVGQALKGRRDSVVLATKFYSPQGTDPNRRGASRRWIIEEVENSLRRLGTDYIDLYQQHRFDPETAPEETLSALSDLMHQGKVRMIGHSAFPPERIVEAQWASERWGLERFRCDQPPYSIFRRRAEAGVLPTCARYGLGVIVYSPLEGGWLSGRYRAAESFTSETRLVRFEERRGGFEVESDLNRLRLQLAQQLAALADEAGVSLLHLAMSFVLEHPDVTSAIIGPRTPEQLSQLLDGGDVRLDESLLDRIDEIVPPGTNVSQVDPFSPQPQLDKSYRRRSLAPSR